QEIRADQHRGDEVLDAFVEAAALPSGLVERHQRLDVLRRYRTPERALHETRCDALCAGPLLLGHLGRAHEDLLAALRRREARGRKRTDDVEVADQARDALLAGVVEAAVGREAVDQILRRGTA